MITGLARAPRSSPFSQTITRLRTPTWGAARPMPGASRMVSSIELIRLVTVVEPVDLRRPRAQDGVAVQTDGEYGHLPVLWVYFGQHPLRRR